MSAIPSPGETYRPQTCSRTETALLHGWRFIRQDVAGAEGINFDDSTWPQTDLPHTWNNLDGEDGGDNYYRGSGWYRLHYRPAETFAGRVCFLKFDGAFLVTDVYVNGIWVGQHKGGFAAFSFDVSSQLKPGHDNVIAVKVNNSPNPEVPPLSADFTFFGGLYREVKLLITDPVHISPLDYGSCGVYLDASRVSSNSADLQVRAILFNASPREATVQIRALIADAWTNIVTTFESNLALSAGLNSTALLSGQIQKPHLWGGLADPYLYRVFVEVRNGSKLVDRVEQPLGFRYFNVDPSNGFFLNGRSYDLHGVSMHQDWVHQGWAVEDQQRVDNFALLKEVGATALRLSHYEHCEHTYDLADRNGLVVWTEIPLINQITDSPAFYANAAQQLRELIRQRYNHPSVICWGIFNEITMKKGPSPTRLAKQLAALAAQENPGRPSVSAANARDDEPSTWCSALSSFNKYFGWYNGEISDLGPWLDSVRAKNPARSIGISEYGAGANPAHHSETCGKPEPGGPFHPEEYQNLLHELHWQQMKARPFVWCKLLWNMADFASDARNEGGLPGLNDKGLVTYDRRLRKDAFYFYKANWTTDPMVYITGHTFTNRMANSITAKVYSNCDSVELFVNENSLGRRSSTNCIYTWAVTLLSGANSVRAVGTKDSKTVSDSLSWNGPAAPASVPTASAKGSVISAKGDSGATTDH